MTFCNKGVVQADPLPPSCGQSPHFYIFFGTLPLVIYCIIEIIMLAPDELFILEPGPGSK